MTLLVDIGNIGSCQLIIPCCRFLEATPMPQPLSVPLRQEIVRRHQQGLPLTQIAAALAIPYGTVRKIWRLYRRRGLERLAPDYGGQGRPVPSSTRELLRIACEIKREHPAWGTGLIRLRAPPARPWGSHPLGAQPPSRFRSSRSPSTAAPPCGHCGGRPSRPSPRDLASRRRRERPAGHRPAHLLAHRDR